MTVLFHKRLPAPGPDTTPPTTPTGLSVTVANPAVLSLSGPSTDNIAVTGYQVWRKTGPGGTFAQIGTTVAFPYTDSTVVNGTTYVWETRAYDAAGNLSPFSTSVTATIPSSGGTGIKWNPGHYMESLIFTELGNLANGSNAGPQKAAEIAVVRAGPAAILGWEGNYYLRAMFNNGSTFDGSNAGCGFDQDYVAATGYVSGTTTSAIYNSPRRVCAYIYHTDFFDPNPADRCVPDAWLNSATFGPIGPDGVHYGYWTTTGEHGAGTGSVAAYWRSAISTPYGNLFAAFGSHVLPDGYTVDTSPYIEWVKIMLETADGPEGATDSSYSAANELAALEALNVAARAGLPHTNVGCTLNYLEAGDTDLLALAAHCLANKVAFSGPDVFGLTSGNTVTGAFGGLTNGQGAYAGLKPGPGDSTPWVSGGIDYRGQVPFLATVQGTELGYLATYTGLDIFNQCNTTLHATHVAWSYITPASAGGVVPTGNQWLGSASTIAQWMTAPGTWGGLLDMIVANPLTHTPYPSAYP